MQNGGLRAAVFVCADVGVPPQLRVIPPRQGRVDAIASGREGMRGDSRSKISCRVICILFIRFKIQLALRRRSRFPHFDTNRGPFGHTSRYPAARGIPATNLRRPRSFKRDGHHRSLARFGPQAVRCHRVFIFSSVSVSLAICYRPDYRRSPPSSTHLPPALLRDKRRAVGRHGVPGRLLLSGTIGRHGTMR